MEKEKTNLKSPEMLKMLVNEMSEPKRLTEIFISLQNKGNDFTYFQLQQINKHLTKVIGKHEILEDNPSGRGCQWNKYYVDDLEVAYQLIDDYFKKKPISANKGKTIAENGKIKIKVSTWKSILSIAYILAPLGSTGCTENELVEQYRKLTNSNLTRYQLDYFNSIMASKGISLDFYNRNSRGNWIRLSNPDTILIIKSILKSEYRTESYELMAKKVTETDKSVEVANPLKLTKLNKEDINKILVQIVELIYLNNGSTTDELIKGLRCYGINLSKESLPRYINELNDNIKSGERYTLGKSYQDIMASLGKDTKVNLVIMTSMTLDQVKLSGMENGSIHVAKVMDSEDRLMEINTQSSKEFWSDLVRHSLLGKLEVISPIWIKTQVNREIEKIMNNINCVIRIR